MKDIYSHVQLSPGDIIKIELAPEGEVSLVVKGLDADTGRLILTDGKTTLVSKWSFFLKCKGYFIPLNE